MFTGIVKEAGTIRGIFAGGGISRFELESKDISACVKIGDSIAINGVCLTVVVIKGTTLSFDVMAETFNRTNLRSLKRGDKVNLEPSLRAGDPIGGHFVLGHVDCEAGIKNIGSDHSIEIEIPSGFEDLVVEKGSIAIDGISLTVGKVGRGAFMLYVIPHTLKATTLGSKRPGDKVNIEFDILGKYVLRLNDPKKGQALTESFLKENGFDV
jgi:riboflavin synthase